MLDNVRSISSGTCENIQHETIDREMCETIATSRNSEFRTVSNSKYAHGCVQIGDSVFYNDTPLLGGASPSDAVQQLCMLPSVADDASTARTPTKASPERMFDGTWLDRGIVNKLTEKLNTEIDTETSGYFPVNIRTIHQAVFYVNP